MESNEIYTLIKYSLCLIFLLFTVVYILKPWLQHCFVQRQKKLDFKQKKEMEYQLLAMSKVKVENQEIVKLKGENEKFKEKIEELEKALEQEHESFNRTALIYKLLQINSELTADKIKKHLKEIENIFESLDKIVNVK